MNNLNGRPPLKSGLPFFKSNHLAGFFFGKNFQFFPKNTLNIGGERKKNFFSLLPNPPK
jgi:hypothetical protein